MTKKENLVRTITRTRPEWIPYRYDGSLTLLRPRITVRPPEGGRDDWGANWIGTGGPEGSFPDGKAVVSPETLENFRAPETDFDAVAEELRGQIARLKDRDTLVVVYNELTLLERAQLSLGNEDFLVATALLPDRAARVLDVITEYQIRLTDSLLKTGASGVRFTDDWGTQSSLLLSPQQWRRLIKPRLKLLYDAVKKYNGFVFQHSCGHIDEIVPDLIEIGVDVLDPCQPKANNVLGWKQAYGDRLSFMGGLDTQSYLSFADPDEVRRQVKAFAAVMGRGGGYIAAPSHSISIPEQNTRAMLQALQDLNASMLPG